MRGWSSTFAHRRRAAASSRAVLAMSVPPTRPRKCLILSANAGLGERANPVDGTGVPRKGSARTPGPLPRLLGNDESSRRSLPAGLRRRGLEVALGFAVARATNLPILAAP